MTGRSAAGVTLDRQPSVLIDRALELLAAGPVDAQTVVTRVCQLPAVASSLAEHLASALLAADDRFVRAADGRWGLHVIAGVSGWKPPAQLLARTPFIVVDVETTGISAIRGDRITEVAAVRVANGRAEVVFDTLINPERPIPSYISALTSITSAMVRNAPTFGEVAAQLAGVLEGHIFVAHNATFDWRFISMEMERATGRPLVGSRLCTVRLAKKLVPTLRRRSLDHVAHYYGIDIGARHRAGGDAIATAQVFLRFLAAAQSLGCTTVEEVEQLIRPGGRRPRHRRRSALPHSVRDDHIA